MTAINIRFFPDYFRAYSWANVNHEARGYPGDSFPAFPWIRSLEDRGAWIAQQPVVKSAPTDYVREILSWGAGKNDPRMRFEAGLGNVSLLALVQPVILNIGDPLRAITAALQLPGCGLTYASKLLRFLNPTLHASLDSRIREALLKADLLPKIHDSNESSMAKGYVRFQQLCNELVQQLESAGIARPECSLPAATSSTGWRIADVEMALFVWADRTLLARGSGA